MRAKTIQHLCMFCTALLWLPTAGDAQTAIVGEAAFQVFNTIGAVAQLDDQGDLRLGGNGRNGDIILSNTSNDQTIALNGGVGDLTLGGNGLNGDIFLEDSADNRTLQLSGSSGNMTLGGGTDDGDLYLRDTDGVTSTIHLDGQAGSLRLGDSSSAQAGLLVIHDNDGLGQVLVNGATGDVYSNQFAGNGLVKAWARINADGTIASCWNCNEDTDETQRLVAGSYEVDFSLLGTSADDIRSRPWICSVGNGGANEISGYSHLHISCLAKNGDNSSIGVTTWRQSVSSGVYPDDTPFTIVIY